MVVGRGGGGEGEWGGGIAHKSLWLGSEPGCEIIHSPTMAVEAAMTSKTANITVGYMQVLRDRKYYGTSILINMQVSSHWVNLL